MQANCISCSKPLANFKIKHLNTKAVMLIYHSINDDEDGGWNK